MKVLVTGCVGFIGFHLSQKLTSKGYKVIGVDSINNYYGTKIKMDRLKILKQNSKKFTFNKGDISNFSFVQKLFKKYKFDQVINLAAQAGVRYSIENPKAYLDSNLVGFFNILECSKKYKVKHLIYASTSSVYGNNSKLPFKESRHADHPIQFYAATKRSNELMAHAFSSLYKLPTTGLRFFTVYGPWGRPDMALFKFTKNILKNKEINVYNDGNHSRSFTYIDDIVDAIDLLLQNYNSKNNFYDILNIGGEESVNLMNFIQVIEHKLGLKAKINFMPKQLGDVEKTESDCSKITSLVDYKPKVPIEDGISQFIDWYKDYYNIGD